MTAHPPTPGRTDGCEPRVSVIIPCFAAARFIAEAVASVLAQRQEGVEILVVDDGSPDGAALAEALRPFGGAVTLLRGPHEGVAAARNRGIRAARGRYLAFLDADDRWKEGFLARQMALLEREEADLVYCDAELFGPRARPGATVMRDHPSRGEVTAAAVLAADCVVVMSTVVVRADRVRAVGGFDAGLRLSEDVDLWVRLLLGGGRFVYHRSALALRRIHGANASRDEEGMLEGALAVVARHEAAAVRDRDDRHRVERRVRRIREAYALLRAKEAILAGESGEARRKLWAVFRQTPRWKPLAAWLSLTLAPGPTLRYLRRRQEAIDLEPRC